MYHKLHFLMWMVHSILAQTVIKKTCQYKQNLFRNQHICITNWSNHIEQIINKHSEVTLYTFLWSATQFNGLIFTIRTMCYSIALLLSSNTLGAVAVAVNLMLRLAFYATKTSNTHFFKICAPICIIFGTILQTITNILSLLILVSWMIKDWTALQEDASTNLD